MFNSSFSMLFSIVLCSVTCVCLYHIVGHIIFFLFRLGARGKHINLSSVLFFHTPESANNRRRENKRKRKGKAN